MMIAEKTYLSLYAQVLLVTGLIMLFTREYVGELETFHLQISNIELALLLLYSFLIIILSFYIYKLLSRKKYNFKNFTISFNKQRFALFYFIWLLISFVFMMTTGVGVLLSQATSPYSPIFGFLNVSALFPIFYFLFRESTFNRYVFWLTVVLFVTYKMFQGWSGVFLLLFSFELYIFFKNRVLNIYKRVAVIFLLPFLFILIGAIFYQYIYPIKNQIRGLDGSEITYVEAVVKLTNRMTNFPIAVGTYEKLEEVKDYFIQDNLAVKEFQGFFRPITPRTLMENKEFRSLNNNVLQPFYHDITASTSSDIGILMYIISLFYCSPLDAFLWLTTSLVMLIFAKIFYDNIEQERGQFDFVFFLLICSLFYTASLEIVFAYGFFGVLYFIPILLILGIIRIKKNILNKVNFIKAQEC